MHEAAGARGCKCRRLRCGRGPPRRPGRPCRAGNRTSGPGRSARPGNPWRWQPRSARGWRVRHARRVARIRDRRRVVVVADEAGRRVGLRHQQRRGAVAAADLGHQRPVPQPSLHAFQRRDPFRDEVGRIARPEEALGAAEQRGIVLVRDHAQTGGPRPRPDSGNGTADPSSRRPPEGERLATASPPRAGAAQPALRRPAATPLIDMWMPRCTRSCTSPVSRCAR